MKKTAHFLPLTAWGFAFLALLFLLEGCASKMGGPMLYDFGPLYTPSNAIALPPIIIGEINAPAWLDGPLLFYRLRYANELQARPYAQSRWSMTPAQLLGHRLKARIAQDGGTVLAATDGVANLPLLRIDIDDFIQNFDSLKQSTAQVTLRASLFNGRILIAQKTFTQQTSAASADATGGARALVNASDTLITDIMAWLAVKK